MNSCLNCLFSSYSIICECICKHEYEIKITKPPKTEYNNVIVGFVCKLCGYIQREFIKDYRELIKDCRNQEGGTIELQGCASIGSGHPLPVISPG